MLSIGIFSIVVSILFFPSSQAVYEIPSGLVQIDSTKLNTWYDAVETCMIQEKDYSHNTTTYWTILDNCKKLHGKSTYDDGFIALKSSAFANKVRGTCCTEDIHLNERGLDWVVKGYEDGNTKIVSTIFKQLSEQNMSMIFLGDSMNNQIFDAFLNEFKREEQSAGGTFEHDIVKQQSWYHNGTIHEQLGLNRKVLSYFPDSFRWTPSPTSNKEKDEVMHPVNVYCITMNYFNTIHEEMMIKNIIIPHLMLQEHPDGVAIFGNIGLHLTNERNNPNSTPLYNHISQFLNWMHDLTIYNPKNIAFFRETTPSHFQSPDEDGSFEKWHDSTLSHYNYLEPNTWDKTMYYCKAIDPTKQIPENIAVQSLLQHWGESSHVHLMPMFQQLAPFYTMKYGHCGGWNRIEVIDCVHYCSWSPPMWIGVWNELHTTLTTALKTRSNTLQNEKYNKEKVYHSGKALPNFNEIMFEDLQILKSSDSKNKYAFYRGLKHPLEENDEEVIKTIYETIDLEKVKVISLTDAEIQKIPTGDMFEKVIHGFPDGTIIKLEGKKHQSIYYMEKGRKRWIPDWDTFVYMKLDMGKVMNLSPSEFEAIPLGPELPHKE